MLSGVGQAKITISTGRKFADKERLRASLRDPLLKKTGGLFKFRRNQLKIKTGLLTDHN
jgi:hypothetical protein